MIEWSLREFLKRLEAEGELICLQEEVDPRFEISALLRKAQEKALLCQRVKGSRIPVVGNLFGDMKKVRMALGLSENDELKEYMARMKRPLPPELVAQGPVKERIYTGQQLDLYQLPVPFISARDGGPYLNAGIVVVKDPEFGPNLSLHRLQLKGSRKTGIFFNPLVHLKSYLERAEAQNKPLEVAVVIGAHPAFYLASQVTGPISLNEYEVAGALLAGPARLVKCETVDLEVPADAEIVLEGRIPPRVREPEGPFGEFTGYYNLNLEPVLMPVIEYTAMTTRSEPVFQTIHIGKPPTEEEPLKALPLAASLFQLLQQVVPEVVDVAFTRGGCARYHAIASLRKRSDGDGKLALAAMLASRIGVKHAVVVDEDINIHDPLEVEWAMATRCQFDKDSLIITDAPHQLDPSLVKHASPLITKVGIDATRPVRLPFPEVCGVPEEVMEKIEKKWKGQQ